MLNTTQITKKILNLGNNSILARDALKRLDHENIRRTLVDSGFSIESADMKELYEKYSLASSGLVIFDDEVQKLEQELYVKETIALAKDEKLGVNNESLTLQETLALLGNHANQVHAAIKANDYLNVRDLIEDLDIRIDDPEMVEFYKRNGIGIGEISVSEAEVVALEKELESKFNTQLDAEIAVYSRAEESKANALDAEAEALDAEAAEFEAEAAELKLEQDFYAGKTTAELKLATEADLADIFNVHDDSRWLENPDTFLDDPQYNMRGFLELRQKEQEPEGQRLLMQEQESLAYIVREKMVRQGIRCSKYDWDNIDVVGAIEAAEVRQRVPMSKEEQDKLYEDIAAGSNNEDSFEIDADFFETDVTPVCFKTPEDYSREDRKTKSDLKKQIKKEKQSLRESLANEKLHTDIDDLEDARETLHALRLAENLTVQEVSPEFSDKELKKYSQKALVQNHKYIPKQARRLKEDAYSFLEAHCRGQDAALAEIRKIANTQNEPKKTSTILRYAVPIVTFLSLGVCGDTIMNQANFKPTKSASATIVEYVKKPKLFKPLVAPAEYVSVKPKSSSRKKEKASYRPVVIKNSRSETNDAPIPVNMGGGSPGPDHVYAGPDQATTSEQFNDHVRQRASIALNQLELQRLNLEDTAAGWDDVEAQLDAYVAKQGIKEKGMDEVVLEKKSPTQRDNLDATTSGWDDVEAQLDAYVAKHGAEKKGMDEIVLEQNNPTQEEVDSGWDDAGEILDAYLAEQQKKEINKQSLWGNLASKVKGAYKKGKGYLLSSVPKDACTTALEVSESAVKNLTKVPERYTSNHDALGVYADIAETAVTRAENACSSDKQPQVNGLRTLLSKYRVADSKASF